VSGARDAGDISFSLSGYSSPLPGSRKFYSLVTQGSQSLALGLTTTAASQLVEATSDVKSDQEEHLAPLKTFWARPVQLQLSGAG
jgi:hypothetical protein